MKRALDFALASIANFNELTQSARMRLAVRSRRWKFVPPTPFGSLAWRLLAPTHKFAGDAGQTAFEIMLPAHTGFPWLKLSGSDC